MDKENSWAGEYLLDGQWFGPYINSIHWRDANRYALSLILLDLLFKSLLYFK